MRVLIADDHQVVRLGVSMIIKRNYLDAIVDEMDDIEQVIPKLKANNYDLVVLDVHMKSTSSLQFIKLLFTIKPDLNIVIYSYLPESVFGIHYIKAGVKAYIDKRSDFAVFEKAINAAINGKRYITTAISEQLTSVLLGEEKEVLPNLSEREAEVLEYMMQGLLVSEIAQKMNLQSSTVSTYKNRIFEKMKTTNILTIKELISIDLFYKNT